MTKEHTVTKLREILQEVNASTSEMKSLSHYLFKKIPGHWGSLHLADGGYFAIIQKPIAQNGNALGIALEAKGYSLKMVSGREALELVRKIADTQDTKMDRRLLKTLHAKAVAKQLYKVTRKNG